MDGMVKKHLPEVLNGVLIIIFITCIYFWWIKSGQVDLDTARQTLSVVVQIEITIFALTIAGLAFVSNVLSNQSARLDRLAQRWLEILVKTNDVLLAQINSIYNAEYQDKRSLSSFYKYPDISHLEDWEIMKYLPAISEYRKAAEANDFTNLHAEALDLNVDSMLFFRISCAVLFSEALRVQRDTNDIHELARKLKDLDHAENIIVLINNIYDSRLAASRGLPIFVFFTLAAIIIALATLSVLSQSTFNYYLYGIAILPIPVIMIFSGYYISQILRRYF